LNRSVFGTAAAVVLWIAALVLVRKVKNQARREAFEAYLFLAPAGALLLVFWFFPVLFSILVSFSDWAGAAKVSTVHWSGFANYQRAWQDPQFRLTLFNTINYVVYSVPLTMAAALGVALLLNSRIRLRSFFRTLYFLPFVTTWVAISIVFKYVFNEQFGLANFLLEKSGLSPLRWLNEPRGVVELILQTGGVHLSAPLHPLLAGPSLAMFTVILTSIWRDTGYFMIIFLAGLQNIDRGYFEAASIDGAGPIQKFRHITWPLLSPTTFFVLIVSFIAAFKVFTPMYIMAPNGTPGGTTETLVSYLFKVGFSGSRELGYASAVAYILFIIILILSVLQNRIFGKSVQYG